MTTKLLSAAKDFLTALDKAIASGSWDETNFVLILGKKLKQMRDNLAEDIKKTEENTSFSYDNLARNIAMRDSLEEVFVSLYSVEGAKLSSWEQIIINLRRQIVSRPIYAKEQEIIEFIKTKEKKINEAYVSIFVKAEDILEIRPDKIQFDKLGQKILVLKDNSISLDCINYFVHLTGKYRYAHGRLLKIES